MAAPVARSLSAAVAQGDLVTVEALLSQGVDLNVKSTDGMTPLGLAAFWGYADIAKVLLKHGADVNVPNRGTAWTPLHCAAFQAHGPVIMRLMEHQPNLTAKDMRGRTPVDFASAHDSIWSFFAAAGCKRTPKSELLKMDIVQKGHGDPPVGEGDFGKREYLLEQPAEYNNQGRDPNMEVAAITGDVLADGNEPGYRQLPVGTLNVYRD